MAMHGGKVQAPITFAHCHNLKSSTQHTSGICYTHIHFLFTGYQSINHLRQRLPLILRQGRRIYKRTPKTSSDQSTSFSKKKDTTNIPNNLASFSRNKGSNPFLASGKSRKQSGVAAVHKNHSSETSAQVSGAERSHPRAVMMNVMTEDRRLVTSLVSRDLICGSLSPRRMNTERVEMFADNIGFSPVFYQITFKFPGKTAENRTKHTHQTLHPPKKLYKPTPLPHNLRLRYNHIQKHSQKRDLQNIRRLLLSNKIGNDSVTSTTTNKTLHHFFVRCYGGECGC